LKDNIPADFLQVAQLITHFNSGFIEIRRLYQKILALTMMISIGIQLQDRQSAIFFL
jgi:hypothetical protein